MYYIPNSFSRFKIEFVVCDVFKAFFPVSQFFPNRGVGYFQVHAFLQIDFLCLLSFIAKLSDSNSAFVRKNMGSGSTHGDR